MDTTPGKESSEFKVVLLNYVAGLFLLGCGALLQYKGKDSSLFLEVGVGLLGINGVGYGVMRTMHKNKVVTAKAQVATSQSAQTVTQTPTN